MTLLDVREPLGVGPYCCFSGRNIRPWHRRLLFWAFNALTALALVAYGLELSQPELTPATGLGLGLGAATLYLLSTLAPRWHAAALLAVFALALRTAIETWGAERPLDLSSLPAWGEAADAGLRRADDFLGQAARTSTLALGAALHAAFALVPIGFLIAAIARSWNLPQRIWFARHHPVWRRPYALGDAPHPLLGVLAVQRDPLLAQKLVWLQLDPDGDALRIGARGPEERADAPRIPLAEQLGDVVLLREGRQWHVSGSLPGGGHAELRSLLVPLHPAGRKALGPRTYGPVDSLPVRDFFADQNALYGKRIPEEREVQLFGLLLDSRPNPDREAPGLPRFCVLIERDGQLEAEYGHPDLAGSLPLELDDDEARIAWRGTEDTTTTLVLERGVDSVHAIRTDADAYHLLFVAFGAHG
ncbi:MAG: hypothetical protein AAFZ65_16315 [Planctomycetota bacterium]